MSIGKRIKLLRVEKGLTQKKLAELAHTDQKNISIYEKELATPSSIILRQIIIALEADPFYLLDIEQSKIKETPSLKLLKEIDTLEEKERMAILVVIENFLELNRIRTKKGKRTK